MIDILVKKTGTGVIDFVGALLKPLQTNSDILEALNNNLLARSYYNGQKMVLQKALNTIFGLAANTIIVETNRSIVNGLYFYNSVELSPVYFSNQAENSPVYFGNAAEYTFANSFVVKIPVGIYTTELNRRIIAETTTYKLGGKTFNTVTY